jgi:hypothetical protein
MAKTVRVKRVGDTSVISLKVTLRGTKPPVWRRILVLGGMTLGDLHQAIQTAMGWDGWHLHAFDIDGRQYGDRRTVDDVADENRLTLDGLLKSGVTRFAYTYDFGDNWEHTVVIEKTRPTNDANGPASPGSATARPRIAEVPGDTSISSKSWLIPLIRNMPNRASGSAKSSTQMSSPLQSPTPHLPLDSTENRTRYTSHPAPKPLA